MVFSKFFRKDSQPISLDLHVDIHSHLIPGIDDGSQDLQESIEILKGFQNNGFKKVITTPHIMGDFYKNTPEIINEGLQTVRDEIEKQDWKLKLMPLQSII